MNLQKRMEENYKETGATMLNQIGKFTLARLGATDFLFDKNMIQFHIRNSHDFNKVVMRLNEMDTYDIELWNCRILKKEPYIINKIVDEFKDVHAAELSGLFEREAIH